MIKKIAIVYPPLKNKKFPHLTQNRWFHYSHSISSKIQPMIASTAATLLYNHGYKVLFLDGINERISYSKFIDKFYNFNPDIAILETKTPIIYTHWKFINKIKKEKNIKFILVGDHITFFPKESLKNSSVDFCISGGDYDVSSLQLIEHLNNRSPMPKGIWYKNKKGEIKNTGKFQLKKILDKLPFINRKLTNWETYGESYLPNRTAYILTGRGCGIKKGKAGNCKFCNWQHSFWDCTARLRSPENVVEEIKKLVVEHNVREIFDDTESGAIWNVKWLEGFYIQLKKNDLLGRVSFSTNARADSLNKKTCELLNKSGFRLLKVGLESGCNKTLTRLNKQESIEEIKENIKRAKDYGLRIMLTLMLGYPWETEKSIRKTYEVVKELMLYKTRFGDALQVSLIIPYPGTPLYYESLKNNWFIFSPSNYEKYDMSTPILKNNIDLSHWGNKIWNIYRHPKFLIKSFFSLSSYKDLLLAWRAIMAYYIHIKEWKNIYLL